jgi:hypothetical protein
MKEDKLLLIDVAKAICLLAAYVESLLPAGQDGEELQAVQQDMKNVIEKIRMRINYGRE